MKIVDVPPCRAYVCIAFFKERMEGALRCTISECDQIREDMENTQNSVQTLLIDWHLNRNMR